MRHDDPPGQDVMTYAPPSFLAANSVPTTLALCTLNLAGCFNLILTMDLESEEIHMYAEIMLSCEHRKCPHVDLTNQSEDTTHR